MWEEDVDIDVEDGFGLVQESGSCVWVMLCVLVEE